jgi:hypothetical protein
VLEATPELAPYVVTPKSGVRVFAGAPTVCLKFANREEWLALGIEQEVVNG